jgi:hypothetical protein
MYLKIYAARIIRYTIRVKIIIKHLGWLLLRVVNNYSKQ